MSWMLACDHSSPAPDSTNRIRAVTTIPSTTAWLRALGGDAVEAETLLPPGASPHVWQPSVASMRMLADADLRVTVGGGMEPWAQQLLSASSRPGQHDVVLVDELELMGLLGPEESSAEHLQVGSGPEHDHGPVNPHVWLSPRLARPLCARLADVLIDLAPDHRAEIERRSAAMQSQLASLESDCARRRALWQGRKIVTFHAAWDHLAEDLGLTVAGVIEPSPGVEPSPAQMRALIDLVRDAGVNAIIAEPQFNDATARRLSEATGVPLVVLNPTGQRDENYFQMMNGIIAELDRVLTPPTQ
jgi:zinc transport system substrate-binding protein